MMCYLNLVNIISQSVMMTFPRRFMLKNISDLDDIIKNQKSDEDIFITKYGDDEKVSTVILDFDGADDKDKVYKEVRKVHYFLKNRGVNSVIVSSTNKGYHFYVQIPTICFDYEHLGLDRVERNKLFVKFTENLIKARDFKLESLDPSNTHAGLGGNIRLLGSKHPKTDKTVSIITGEFLDLNNDTVKEDYYEQCSHYVNIIYERTIIEYNLTKDRNKKLLEKRKRRWKGTKWENDPIEENDLRDLLPSIYGGTVRNYGNYIFMQCPWHVDRKPSLKVTKRWFYCLGCGEKGNIWTLIKRGEIRL